MDENKFFLLVTEKYLKLEMKSYTKLKWNEIKIDNNQTYFIMKCRHDIHINNWEMLCFPIVHYLIFEA